MRYTADTALIELFNLRTIVPVPKSPDLFDRKLDMSRYCVNPCCGDKRMGPINEPGRGWICRKCRHEWPVETRMFSRTYSKRGHRYGTPAELARKIEGQHEEMFELSLLEEVFENIGLWESRVWPRVVFGHWSSLREVAQECADRWPWVKDAWTEDHVARILREARSKVRGRLQIRGMLVFGER